MTTRNSLFDGLGHCTNVTLNCIPEVKVKMRREGKSLDVDDMFKMFSLDSTALTISAMLRLQQKIEGLC
jgi:hypothetical protein